MHTATYYIDLLLSGITVGSLYALIAIGYTMVYGILRLINFAHGDIFMMAGFFMVYISASMPMAVAIPVVLIMTTDRANSVLQYLLTGKGAKLDGYAEYFCAAGYGATRPVASNDTAEGQAANRRIEISMILKDESVLEIVEQYLAMEVPGTDANAAASPSPSPSASPRP